MTHTPSHVIIDALKTPINPDKPNGWKLWHYVAILCVLCFVAGALF